MHQIENSDVEVGTLVFDTRNEKILKPLCTREISQRRNSLASK